jgi:outer membrane protein assembly factor BamB
MTLRLRAYDLQRHQGRSPWAGQTPMMRLTVTIVTALHPETGMEFGQGRLKGAIDHYYASPVAADGKIFMSSETGKVVVLAAGGSLEPLAVNDLGDDIYATTAISGGRIYLRTRSWLDCFGSV